MPTQIPFSLDEVPLQDERRLELYQALTDYDNYYEVSQVLWKHSKELTNAQALKVQKPLQHLRYDREFGRRISVLLHAIPRGLLEAIILGTVSRYFLSVPLSTPDCYDSEGPGTYVAAMSITGRGGCFTSVEENEKLIDALRKYCMAYQGQNLRQGAPPRSVADMQLDLFARKVDRAIGSRPGSKKDQVRFIQSDKALKMVSLLIGSFERRCEPSRSQGASRTTYHKQGPLMVGCSNQIDERMPHHEPYSSSGLSQTTYTWALTLCLIVSELKLVPEVVVRPVIRTWENDDLCPSEILVSALGASYVFQDGFNVVGAGSQKGDKPSSVLIDAKEHVFLTKPWFQDNIDATRKELEKHKEYIDDALTCSDFPTADLRLALQAYSTNMWRTKALANERDALYEKKLRRVEEKREHLKQLQQRMEAKKHFSHIVSSLLGRPPHDLDKDAGTSSGDA
ncbi:hypothetical protein F4818DRAFT_438855 [Hypoxylon cercidicola]|nr:hypothetical protein F4818DRAFT_438855 [Hypoxylon cercidicola]